MNSIVPSRSCLSERFPVASFSVQVPHDRYYEVACATDPRLFHPDHAGRRSSSNFYSSRAKGMLLARRGANSYVLPASTLERFAGARRLYYALGTYGGRDGRDACFSISPATLAETPSIELAAGLGAGPRYGGGPAPRSDYGEGAGGRAVLRWGGDEAIEALRSRSTHGGDYGAPSRGHESYDDGYDATLWQPGAYGDPTQAALLATYPAVSDYRSSAHAGHRKRKNPIERIDTICLHQMAVASVRGVAGTMAVPPSLSHLGSNTGSIYVPTKTGRESRWKKLKIHFAITCGTGSKSYWMHDLTWRLGHGHGWNRRSVGLEFEGYFAGCHDLSAGKYRYFWRPKGSQRKPMVPTEEQLEAGRQTCRFIIGEIARLGGEIKYVAAHRQSYGLKTSDPGALIWQGVASPILTEFGLKIGPTLPQKRHPGRPIPECWDPARAPGVPYR